MKQKVYGVIVHLARIEVLHTSELGAKPGSSTNKGVYTVGIAGQIVALLLKSSGGLTPSALTKPIPLKNK